MNDQEKARQMAEDMKLSKKILLGEAEMFDEAGIELCHRVVRTLMDSAMMGIAFAYQDRVKAKYSNEIRSDLLSQAAQLFEAAAGQKLLLSLMKIADEDSKHHLQAVFADMYQSAYEKDRNLRKFARTLVHELEKDESK